MGLSTIERKTKAKSMKEYFIRAVVVGGKTYKLCSLGNSLTAKAILYIDGQPKVFDSRKQANQFIANG